MAELIFADHEECNQLQKELKQMARSLNIKPSFLESESRSLLLNTTEHLDSIVQVLACYTRKKLEESRILFFIEHFFYFTDKQEQAEIAAIAKEFIEQEREEVPAVKDLDTCDYHVKEAWRKILTEEGLSFTFESFVQFRLREYLDLLQIYVECAIDEYKLELEYQSFIDQLRKCAADQPFLTAEVHVAFDGKFKLYDEEYRLYSEKMLQLMHERALVLTKEFNLDEKVLGPIMGLAPEVLYLYLEEENHGMIHTLQNVFQERLIKRPLQLFYGSRNKFIEKMDGR
ncbi:sporulation protein YtxC [Fictibacillus sp. KU28468]|uniref:sporulation protein YtxC n=1 Tax=Fictibacillus sp. KU28468 TaxID=2991053 RepID=UPI00223DD271|nr:sporulation protein YtxC [Fictibacillus sp. KU28468]UZJ80340.1 sporulation protein YtxC [Fictibacillus sp. KU28468]